MTFFTVAATLIAVLVNACYLRQMTRARSRSLAELLLLIAFDAGLAWIVAAQASARPGF
jgi:inner membrane protein involved in colicin E2 resistance